jgi:hypothetical protein
VPGDAVQAQRSAVRATVEALKDCLLGSGMSCPLAESLISPVSGGEPIHYISTLYQLERDSQVRFDIMAGTYISPPFRAVFLNRQSALLRMTMPLHQAAHTRPKQVFTGAVHCF